VVAGALPGPEGVAAATLRHGGAGGAALPKD